ncbi:hypothetical protein K492DRAFT_208867 [Lichtheimia hyalospora FSU 10163]|nr:hypothetical protein K492DRAFT_208867 [Lichtheimia hyalospora FSU 10163]
MDDPESYQYQLEQVELALGSDPNNEELKKLQHDLKELISLTAQLEEQQQQQSPSSQTAKKQAKSASPVTPSTPHGSSPSSSPAPVLKTHQFAVGQEVLARWSGDSQFYRATITAIGGADQVFSVVFRGYQENEFVKAEDIKALDNKRRKGIFEDVMPSKKSKKDSNKEKPSNDVQQQQQQQQKPKKKKVSEVEVKKNAWQNFASSAQKQKKKGRMAATPINKKSIFKTPDNPDSKVGVVGSGRGMTSYQQRGKHLFTDSPQEEE